MSTDDKAMQELLERLGVRRPSPPAAPDPLLPTKDDPDLLAGAAAKRQYLDALQEIRFIDSPDISKARTIAAMWTQLNRTLAGHFEAYRTRVAARHDYLGAKLPVGPGIPDDTSPADRAVLMAAWNNALATARTSTANPARKHHPDGTADTMSRGRAAMLADAERFGDDTTRRAIITTYLDEGRWDLVEAWALTQPSEALPEIREWLDLGKILDGHHFDWAWIRQYIGQPVKPDEVHALVGLVTAYNATVDAYNLTLPVRSGKRQRRERIELTPDELIAVQP